MNLGLNLVVRRGQIVLVGIIWGRKWWPLYGVEGWPRNRGFLCTILRAMQSGPRSESAIGRVVAYQGWSLRGVPLYSKLISHTVLNARGAHAETYYKVYRTASVQPSRRVS